MLILDVDLDKFLEIDKKFATRILRNRFVEIARLNTSLEKWAWIRKKVSSCIIVVRIPGISLSIPIDPCAKNATSDASKQAKQASKQASKAEV